MKKTTILLAEDEPQMILGLRKVLEAEGYAVVVAENGEAALRLLESESPELMVLDVMLPRKDGFRVVRELRARDCRVPVLMLTAKSEEADKVLGLELGADDYLTKPFGLPELLARIRALLRRVTERVDRLQTTAFGGMEVDFLRQTIRKGEQAVLLSHHENAVLRLLVAFKDEPVTRAKLLSAVWGDDRVQGTRVVDFHITNLRKKLESIGGKSRHILSVHGIGYRFVP